MYIDKIVFNGTILASYSIRSFNLDGTFMHKRYTILFSLLLAPTLQAADPTDVRSIMNLYTQITGTFNVDHSIEEGINDQELVSLNKRLNETNTALSTYHYYDPKFEQQVLNPLRGVHLALQTNIAYLHCLHRGLRVVRTNDDDPAALCSNLHEELSQLSDEQNGRLAQCFAPLIFKQLHTEHKGVDFSTMGSLLTTCNDNKYAAVVYGLKHQDPEPRNLIGRLILAQKAPIETQLLKTMQADIDAPDGLPFHQKELGSIVIKILENQKNGSKPQSWVKTVPWLASSIFNENENSIYTAFQGVFQSKEGQTVAHDLQELLSSHHCTTHEDVKHFLSQLERYDHQLESRPPINLTLGFTALTDSARYSDHKEITKKLIAHLHSLYLGIMTDLDDQIMLHTQPNPYDLMVQLPALGYAAVISGIRNELEEIKRESVQEENPDFTDI